MKLRWGAVMVVASAVGWTGSARADVDLVVFAGTSRATDGPALDPAGGRGCTLCAASQVGLPEVRSADTRRLAALAIGLVGTEGHVRGGGEVSTLIGFDGASTGFSSLVTYVGADGGRVFAHFGLCIGSYWGDGRFGELSSVAGIARGELGLRLARHWMLAARGDLLVGDDATVPVLSFGLQWAPVSL